VNFAFIIIPQDGDIGQSRSFAPKALGYHRIIHTLSADPQEGQATANILRNVRIGQNGVEQGA
jgi:hypothetical protein